MMIRENSNMTKFYSCCSSYIFILENHANGTFELTSLDSMSCISDITTRELKKNSSLLIYTSQTSFREEKEWKEKMRWWWNKNAFLSLDFFSFVLPRESESERENETSYTLFLEKRLVGSLFLLFISSSPASVFLQWKSFLSMTGLIPLHLEFLLLSVVNTFPSSTQLLIHSLRSIHSSRLCVYCFASKIHYSSFLSLSYSNLVTFSFSVVVV